jgi:lipopolysaccharide export LptBFGC system permease protein LptF
MEWSTNFVIHQQIWYRIGIPTWWRYFFVRFGLLTVALSVLAFGLFVFVDLLSHVKDVFDPETSWKIWRTYYLCLLSYRLQVLIPFSLAAATALFIPRIIRSNELIPLLNAGVSLRQIFRPFLAIALLNSLLLWVNTQYILPRAIRGHDKISESDFGRKTVHDVPSRLGVVLFPEGSRLFFYQHDPVTRKITDVFWVRSADCVLHIEQLVYFSDRAPEGHGVDVIERDPSGRMQKTESYPFCELSQLQFTRETVKMSTADPRDLSITQLGTLMSRFGSSHSERATETTVAFYTKIFSPLLALLAVLIPAPLCFRFERRFPQALLVFGSLASLFCFQLAIHASVVLARIPIVRPTPVLLIPWAAALFFGFRRIVRLGAVKE